MKSISVQSLVDGINEILPKIKSQMTQLKALETQVVNFIELEDIFIGEGGNAIRNFYRDWHLPFLSYRYSILEKYESILNNLKQATFQLESDTNGYIEQRFLEGNLMEGINNIKTITSSLVDEGNSYMDSVSDIVYLPRLFHGSFQGNTQRATSHITHTIEDLHSYDDAETNELQTLDHDLHLMKNYLQELSGIFKNETFQMKHYNLNLKEYPSYQKLKHTLQK